MVFFSIQFEQSCQSLFIDRNLTLTIRMRCTYLRRSNRLKSTWFSSEFSPIIGINSARKWLFRVWILKRKTMTLKIVSTVHCILTIELMQMQATTTTTEQKSMQPKQCECTANYWNDDCILKAHLNRFCNSFRHDVLRFYLSNFSLSSIGTIEVSVCK